MLRAFAVFILTTSLSAAGAPASAGSGDLYLTRGRMIDVGGHRLNMYCMGSGSPTVVFDSGLEDWSPAWVTIQPAIANTTRACTYDRAGNGLSDAGPMPRTTARIVSDLHALLHDSAEPGPYILVGHSFGGINVRHYADRYLSDVAGLVLDDASAEQGVLYMSAKDKRETNEGIAKEQHFMSTCEAQAQRHFHGIPAKQLHKCLRLFFRGLPNPKDFPGPLDRVVVNEAEQPKQFAASASEYGNFTVAGEQTLLREHRSYGSIPLRILVAYHHHGASAKDELLWQRMHRQWLHLSTDARYIAATKSGHYIQFDQPYLVINAIRDEIAIVRREHKQQ